MATKCTPPSLLLSLHWGPLESIGDYWGPRQASESGPISVLSVNRSISRSMGRCLAILPLMTSAHPPDVSRHAEKQATPAPSAPPRRTRPSSDHCHHGLQTQNSPAAAALPTSNLAGCDQVSSRLLDRHIPQLQYSALKTALGSCCWCRLSRISLGLQHGKTLMTQWL